MPLKCYRKPNRSKPRLFNAKAAGRVVCAAIENGSLPSEVRESILRCFKDQEEQCDCDALKNRLRELEAFALQLEGVIAAIITLLLLYRPLRAVLARTPAGRTGQIVIRPSERAALEAAERQREAAQRALDKMLRDLEKERELIKNVLSAPGPGTGSGPGSIIISP
jgi:hypothetical protein